jgi:hypothetical protein
LVRQNCRIGIVELIVLSRAGSSDKNGEVNFFEDQGVWKSAPILIGQTKFEPQPDVKNIMITGGAGFMCVSLFLPLND